jgi:hypoxanthine phosphoribosyltransferase
MQMSLLYSEEQLAAEIRRLADTISADFAGEELVLVVVLKGAFIFAADLLRKLRVPLSVDFIRLRSYQGTSTTGKVSLLSDIVIPIEGKHVVVVEDIVDTGLSLEFLLHHLRRRGPKSLKVCALIDKQSRRRAAVTADYSGFTCADEFLVGYGLDLDERFRELPAIYKLLTDSPDGGLNDSPV